MGIVGRRIGLSLIVLAVAAGTAVTVAMADRDDAEPEAGTPDQAPSPPSWSPSPSASEPPTGPPLLLPNMRSLAAADLQVQQFPGGRLLRFSASLANVGPGPLLLRPRPPDVRCPRGQHPARQVLHLDDNEDGAYQPRRDLPDRQRHAGCMLAHPTHDHWHFDAMAGYALRSPATDRRLSTRHKVSFCLRDNFRIRGAETRVRREHFGECGRTRPQGISPGWVDVYPADLTGQSLLLPPGAGRREFCLDLTADPKDLLEETDESDNATSIGVIVNGDQVRRGPRGPCLRD